MNTFLEHAGLKKDIDARMLLIRITGDVIRWKDHAFNRLGLCQQQLVENCWSRRRFLLWTSTRRWNEPDFEEVPYYQKVL
jgi:hypothetical protein